MSNDGSRTPPKPWELVLSDLNLISRLATLEGARETCRLCALIAAHYRYSAREESGLVEMRAELDAVETRFAIARYRDGARLRCVVEREPEAEGCLIPALLILRCADEAVEWRHRFDRGGAVRVDLRTEPGRVAVRILDAESESGLTGAARLWSGEAEGSEGSDTGGSARRAAARRLGAYWAAERAGAAIAAVQVAETPEQARVCILRVPA